MAVTNITPVATYTGNGSTKDFSFSFKINDKTDVKLFIDNVAKTYSTDYTVDKLTSILTTVIAPSNGVGIRLQRNTTLSRDVDYAEGGGLSSTTLDTDLDKLMLLIQDQYTQSLTQDIGSIDYNVGNSNIINVAEPINAQDSATKAYVDATTLVISTHIADVDNPHNVTKTQLNLGNVDNTSDIAKPVSDSVQTALNLKANLNQVLTNVPAGAVFTDTLYSKASIDAMGINALYLNGNDISHFATAIHNHSGTYANFTHFHSEYEPVISKFSAFNKNFGNGPNTVCTGDDPRLSDYRNPLGHSHLMSEISDLNINGVSGFVQETQPVTGVAGDIWFGTTSLELKVHDGVNYREQNLNDGYF